MASQNQFSAARPKRAGDQFTRTHHLDADEPSSKKPRFDYRNPSTLAPDAAEDDPVLELDEIGKGAGTKRNAVNIDGYESDSSTENFDARATAKAKATSKPSKDEEDNDMFADLDEDFKDGDEDEDLNREGKKKKGVRFLEAEEIEGQEATSKSGGHVKVDFRGGGKSREEDNNESSSDSGDDEERDRMGSDVDEEVGAGGKKKNAPRLDAFNVRSEKEDGAFDESGNYVRKATDPDAVHDSWLEGLSKKDMKRAKEAQEKREAERRQRDIADDSIATSDILGTLIALLEKGETPLEALQRLGKSKEKKKPKWQKNKRKNEDDMQVDQDNEADTAETKRKETIEAITEAADQLLTRGQLEVYEAEREVLIRQYKRETGDEWVDKKTEDQGANGAGEAKQWEYRWSDARDGGEKHGPYDGQTMLAWNNAGYFGEGVEFRRIGDSEWSRVVDFV